MGIVALSTSRQLKDESLSFVRDGWTIFEIKIKLFDGEAFDKEVKRISRPLDRVPGQWKETDPHELMHVEGLFLNDFFLLRCSLNAEGRGQDRGVPYTFVLNKYKYFATYEVCSARSLPPLICFSCFTV